MAPPRFDVLFAGECLAGWPAAQVKALLGQRFGLQGAQLDALFSGKPVRIKGGVDADTSERYRALLAEAGAVAIIRPVVAQASFELLPPNTGSLAEFAPRTPPAPAPDLSGMSLATPGTPLDDRPPPEPRIIDTRHLSASPPGDQPLSAPLPPGGKGQR